VRAKLAIVVAAVLGVAVLIGFYVGFLTGGPTPYTPPAANAANGRSVDLTLQTVAAVGSKLSPNKNWVSYLVREQGVWHRSTVWTLPAHALVHVTIYNFDGQSGLRNPFLAQARGLVGGTFAINGKPTSTIDPDAASHTFAIPSLGVIVPVLGIADDARDDHVHVPHRQGRPLSLAVLRAVRRRLRLRLRRADADRRLHGWVRQCGLAAGTAGASAP
jgi:hypothetical protein